MAVIFNLGVGSLDDFLTFIFALCSGITLLTKLCFKGSNMLGISALWCDSSNPKILVPSVRPTGFDQVDNPRAA